MKNSFQKIMATLLLGSCLIFPAKLAQAQQSKQDVLTINTDLVVTWGQINRTDGSPLKGLGVDDLQLWEENKPQQIALVKEGQPLSVVLLVDGMGCASFPEIEFQRSQEALRQLGDDAEIALMAWDSKVVLMQPFTRNQELITERLKDRLGFFEVLNGTRTALRPDRDWHRPGDAIFQATQYLEKAASPERRKVIIVISRSYLGMAQTSTHTADEVKKSLESSGTTVYALLENDGIKRAYGASDRYFFAISRVRKYDQRRRLAGTLEEFVNVTGGSFLTSKNQAWLSPISLIPNAEFGKEFDELFIKLTSLIRSSYTIGYYPDNTNFDGRFRRIKLELSKSGQAKAGNVNIQTRNGYHAVRKPVPEITQKNLQ